MEEKIEEVVKQYPVQLIGKRRIRGAILLEAKEGLFTLVHYKEGDRKLLFQEKVKQELIRQGYPFIDEGIRNNSQDLLTKDSMGNRWLLKRWYPGRECNLRDEADMIQATEHLAKLHTLMRCPANDTEELLEDEITSDKDLQVLLERHMREMKRVYNYIRGKKKRNEMEICILNLFQKFYDQAGFANMYIDEIDYHSLFSQCIRERRVYHGSYNYHNIIFQEKQIITTNFEEGQIFKGKVISIKEFGAFLEFAPGKEGMIHISKLSDKRVDKVEDVVKIGDVVKVEIIKIGDKGIDLRLLEKLS